MGQAISLGKNKGFSKAQRNHSPDSGEAIPEEKENGVWTKAIHKRQRRM